MGTAFGGRDLRVESGLSHRAGGESGHIQPRNRLWSADGPLRAVAGAHRHDLARRPSVGADRVVWRDQVWSTAARMHYTLVVVAIVVFAIFLYYWNLLGIRG